MEMHRSLNVIHNSSYNLYQVIHSARLNHMGDACPNHVHLTGRFNERGWGGGGGLLVIGSN